MAAKKYSSLIKDTHYILHKSLSEALQQGQSSAFERIYFLYKDQLYGFCFKLLASEELSKEVVQETFIRLWEKRGSIDSDKSLQAYLYTIAKNLIKDHQAQYVRQYQATHQLMQYNEPGYNSTQQMLLFEEIRELEKTIVSRLPPQQGEVYRLSRYQQLSHQEIADSLHISVNSVKTHLRLALKTLRSHIMHVSDILLIVMVMLLPY